MMNVCMHVCTVPGGLRLNFFIISSEQDPRQPWKYIDTYIDTYIHTYIHTITESEMSAYRIGNLCKESLSRPQLYAARKRVLCREVTTYARIVCMYVCMYVYMYLCMYE